MKPLTTHRGLFSILFREFVEMLFCLVRSACGWWLAAWLSVSLLSGCGGSGGYNGPTGTVKGKVTYLGKPVDEGTVVAFLSDEGYAASGKVGADGSYTLQSGTGTEVPVGTYKVSVTSISRAVVDMTPEQAMRMSQQPGGMPKADKAAVPSKYNTPGTSGLSYSVSKGENTINIELK